MRLHVAEIDIRVHVISTCRKGVEDWPLRRHAAKSFAFHCEQSRWEVLNLSSNCIAFSFYVQIRLYVNSRLRLSAFMRHIRRSPRRPPTKFRAHGLLCREAFYAGVVRDQGQPTECSARRTLDDRLHGVPVFEIAVLHHQFIKIAKNHQTFSTSDSSFLFSAVSK